MAGKGGARLGAGRKSRAEEMGLESLMNSIGKSEDVLKAIYEAATTGKNLEAQKVWLAYYFGKPKESIAIDGGVELKVTRKVVK